MSSSVLCSFNSLFSLSEYAIEKIIIPSIQRDYAQGRKNDSTIERIRKRFLSSLKGCIVGNGQLYLDFIYGFIEEGVLTPLDGQQRLTTLFLLYWYASKKEGISKEECCFLKKFTYQIRPSSNDFCERIVDFEPFFNGEALSSQIIEQSWFPYDWSNDPTINSMLNMIDKIDEEFCDVDNIWKRLVDDNCIVFHFLSLKDLGLTDDIYIKMNSRGKPLTPFECFKAELEQKIDDQATRDRIVEKIDMKWTDFLWKYKNGDFLIGSFFLNYFRFICDIISLFNNDRIQERGYDEIDLLDLYFSESCPNYRSNLELLEKSMDSLCDFDPDLSANLFGKYLTNDDDIGKTKIFDGKIDLLKDCFENYIDVKTKQRPQSFGFRKIILLYAFVCYCMNKSNIQENEFRERIRIVNNLTLNSDEELVDRATNSRLPAIVRQTKTIIIRGEIKVDEECTNGFNAFQISEEIEKQQWRTNNIGQINSLNALEDFELLKGQISIVGLENIDLSDKFIKLFSCDRDLVSCALLTICDYSQRERNWRYTLGTRKNDSSWIFLFHKSSATNSEETKRAIITLLRQVDDISEDALNTLCNEFLSRCEADSSYPWRYYFIKYPQFRPDSYGKYSFEPNEQYTMLALTTKQNISEYSFQPFLKIIDKDNLDTSAYGRRIKANGNYLYCKEDRYELCDAEGNVLGNPLIIAQNDGVDTENRVEKYFANPLC